MFMLMVVGLQSFAFYGIPRVHGICVSVCNLHAVSWNLMGEWNAIDKFRGV